jgi:protease PrsW
MTTTAEAASPDPRRSPDSSGSAGARPSGPAAAPVSSGPAGPPDPLDPAAAAGRRTAAPWAGFYQPRRAAFWVYLILLVGFGAVTLWNLGVGAAAVGAATFLLVLAVWGVWAAVALGVVHYLDLFGVRPRSLLVAAFGWGALTAGGIALTANDGVLGIYAKVAPAFGATWGASLTAPFTEEVSKVLGVVLLMLLSPRVVHGLLDGFVYGAVIGVGYQVVENIDYTLMGLAQADTGTSAAMATMLLGRGVLTGIVSHAAYTGLTGMAVAYLLTRRGWWPARRRWQVAGALFLTAAAAHALSDMPGVLMLVGNTLPIAAVVYAYWRARRADHRQVQAVLATDVTRGVVTAEEVHALGTRRWRRQERGRVRRTQGPAVAARVPALQRAQLLYAAARTEAVTHPDPSDADRIHILRLGILTLRSAPALTRPG